MNDNKLYRVWEIQGGKEKPLPDQQPAAFADARLTMRMHAIGSLARQLGWQLRSQGPDYMIYRMPNGNPFELRIRCETPEATAYEAVAGLRYTVDEGLEYVSDYTVTANMPTPSDGLFDYRDGKDTQEVEVAHV